MYERLSAMSDAPAQDISDSRADDMGHLLLRLDAEAAPVALKKRIDEGADTYPAIVAILNTRHRVIECRDRLQWILQRKGGKGSNSWRGVSFSQSKGALLRCIRERAGPVATTALGVVHALPERIWRPPPLSKAKAAVTAITTALQDQSKQNHRPLKYPPRRRAARVKAALAQNVPPDCSKMRGQS